MATGDTLLANTRAIGHVTVESRESYIRRKMAENGWDRQTAIAQATHLYPEEMDDLRAPWANRQLYTGEGGHSPDTAAQALHDEGRLADPTVDAFWDAVRGDIDTIGKAKRRELDAAEAEAAAALAWGKERHDQTLAAIEMQDDAVGLGMGEARSSIGGARTTNHVGNDVLTTLEDLDVGKDVFFDLKGRGRLRVTLGQDGPGGFGIMHIVEGRMLKDGQTLDGAIRTVLRVVEAAAHGENKGERQKRQRYEKDGAVAIIAHEDDKADGTPGKGDFVLTGYEEFANDAEREKADARTAALRRAGRYALPPHARSEEVVNALHRIIANLHAERQGRSSIGGDTLPQKTPLVAMHFLSASHLASALRRGGLPSPSIAVSRDTEGWDLPNSYGDCLLFFKKDTVDPRKDPRNLIFPGDAMTPRHPKDSIKKGGLDHALNELRSLGWDALTEQTLRNEALNLVMRTRTEADDEIETPALFALWVNQTTGERLADANAVRAYAERFRDNASGTIKPWLKDRYGRESNFFSDIGRIVSYSGKAPTSAKAAQEAMDSTTVKPKTSVADTRYAAGDLMYAVLFSFGDIEAARDAIKNSEELETGTFRAARERLADALVKPGVERNTSIRRFVNTLANETTLENALALFEQENPWFSTTPEARQAFLDLVDTTLREKKGYYEAKPRRIVGLDEIALAVIPQDQVRLKWELEKRGIPYETYPASDTYAIDQNHEVAQRAVAHARFSIGGIFTGARMPYDRADIRFVGSGTGGQNEGFGLYGSSRRGVAQGKYASAYIPKKPKTWAQLPVNGDKRFPTLGKLGRICKTWTRVIPNKEKNAWIFFAALANDAVSGKLPKGNVKEALKQAIRDELERERQAAEAYHAWRDATIQALLRGEQAEHKTRRQEAAEARAASAYETYIKLGFDKDEVLDERLNELLDVPTFQPAVMEQVWFTNRPEGDLSHLLNWLEPVPEEQKRWIKRAFERRHGDAETRSIVDNALAEEKITGRDLYEALRQFYWGILRDTGMVTTDDLIQSEVAQFLLSADIDGTRYPVDYRKGVTDGSHGWNYVAFSDEHMRVVRRWVWNEATEEFELDRSFTPPTPTMAEARATAGDDQAIAEAQASRSSIIGRIGARRLDWAGYRLTEDEHGTRRLVQGQDGRTLFEGLRDADAEVKARVAGASAMTPYGYEMDAYFHHALELTEGEIRDETGTWRRQTYDDLTLKAQRDKILRGQDDATQGILNQFTNAKTLEALAKLAKKHLDVTAMTWGPKEGGGFEVTVEYDDDVIWWNTYASETGALNSMRRIFLNRYANRTSEARSSISGRRLSKKKPIEAMTYGARVGVFREAQKRPSNGSGIDEKRFVHVADLPQWAEELGLSGPLMANGSVLRKLAKKHNINARAFAKFIESIERPVAAFIELPDKTLEAGTAITMPSFSFSKSISQTNPASCARTLDCFRVVGAKKKPRGAGLFGGLGGA